MRKAPKGGDLHPLEESASRIIAKVLTQVEHLFRVIKCQFGHVKTRYRGLTKNRPSSLRCSPSTTCLWCGES
jgi:IS5 family transposase